MPQPTQVASRAHRQQIQRWLLAVRLPLGAFLRRRGGRMNFGASATWWLPLCGRLNHPLPRRARRVFRGPVRDQLAHFVTHESHRPIDPADTAAIDRRVRGIRSGKHRASFSPPAIGVQALLRRLAGEKPGILGHPAVLVLSMAKLAPITVLPEPIGSILRLAELIERGGCSA
jgi:hypothetical protein